MKSIIVKPPKLPVERKVMIFTGGSIEMGKAENWQTKFENHILEKFPEDVQIYNPRRDDWDSSLPQDPTPGTVFHQQVMLEMLGQEKADIIAYYFDSATISPITLLEMGTYKDRNVFVKCSPEYFRYGNVKIFCDEYDIPLVHKYEELEALIDKEITRRLTR